MRAAVWHGARDVRVEEVPEPGPPDRGDAVVEVRYACVCASDVAEYRDGPHVIPTTRPHALTGRTAPLVLGHEYVGTVVAVGDAVDGLAVGDRVCGDACIRCGTCFWCRRGEYNICDKGGSVGLHTDGAFAPLVTVPAYTLVAVPDGVGDLAASVTEPLAVGLHALARGRLEVGETVAVFGFGMVGAAVALLARAAGAGQVVVVEPNSARRALADVLGVDAAVDPTGDDTVRAVRRRTGRRGADVVLDCTGSAGVLSAAVESARRGGRVVLCGLPHGTSEVAPDRLVYFEREVVGALGYRDDHDAVLQLVASGRVDPAPLLGDPVSLERIVDDAIARTLDDPAAPLRIPVIPGPDVA